MKTKSSKEQKTTENHTYPIQVAVIGTVGLPARYGGFETFAEQLAKHISENFNLHVYCTTKGRTDRPKTYNGATLHYIPIGANGIESTVYDGLSMLHCIKYADVLMILGVSGAIFLPLIKLFARNKIILIHLDGIEWKRAKWRGLSKAFLRLSEYMAVKLADICVADNEHIQSYLLRSYNTKSAMITYGGDHVTSLFYDAEIEKKYPFLQMGFAVSVCRIEPENNIELILGSFSVVANSRLVMIGNWDKSAYGRSLRRHYETFPNIFLLDPIYDTREINYIRQSASFYVHGHSVGGTNPSLVEAMTLGLPILAFDVSFNRATTFSQAIYFHDRMTLQQILESISTAPLTQVGAAMKLCAQENYRWADIVANYEDLFITLRADTHTAESKGRSDGKYRIGSSANT